MDNEGPQCDFHRNRARVSVPASAATPLPGTVTDKPQGAVAMAGGATTQCMIDDGH